MCFDMKESLSIEFEMKRFSHPSTPFTINLKEPLRLYYVVYYKHFHLSFMGVSCGVVVIVNYINYV